MASYISSVCNYFLENPSLLFGLFGYAVSQFFFQAISTKFIVLLFSLFFVPHRPLFIFIFCAITIPEIIWTDYTLQRLQNVKEPFVHWKELDLKPGDIIEFERTLP